MIVLKTMNFLTTSRSALRSSSLLCVKINNQYIKASKLCTVRDAENSLSSLSRRFFPLNHKTYSTQSISLLDRCAINYHFRSRNLCQPDKIYIQRISLLHDGEKSKTESTKSKHFALKLSFYNLIACVIMGTGGALYVWGSEKVDESGKPIEDEYSSEPYLMATIMRTYAGAKNYWLSYRDPFRETLLPPPLEYPYIQPKYTLVIEPNGVLLHPEWTFKTGWRFKKRPYVDYFLQNCGPPVFEAVVFTSDSAWSTAGLAESLDPRGNVMHWLFRDATRWIDGARVKDLNYLNRDLSKVIMVEWDRNACKMNPNNCLFLKKYEGADEDRTLFELAHFLRTIAIQGVDDVREIINHYSKFDDPLAVFRENQRAALELEEEKRKKAKSQSFVSTFTRK